MARVTRFSVRVSSTSCWNPNFSSMVTTGNSLPYAVRFLPSKSYGVEAPILLGPAMSSSAPCLAGFLPLCSFLLFTVWVTPEDQLAKVALRGSSVLTQDFRGPQMGASFRRADLAQFLCIRQL